jgi:hypothetical protein
MDVIDPVGQRAAQLGVDKVVNIDEFGRALWTPLPAAIFEITHQFLAFSVNR